MNLSGLFVIATPTDKLSSGKVGWNYPVLWTQPDAKARFAQNAPQDILNTLP